MPTNEESTQTVAEETERTAPSTVSTATNSDTASNIFGVAIWIAILGGIAWSVLWHTPAQVMLDIQNENPPVAAGTVTFDGKPASGVLHITVANAKTKRYLSGVVIPIEATKEGTFTTGKTPLYEREINKDPLRITADFEGISADKKPVSGTATTYIDFAPPIETRTLAVITGSSIALIAVLTILFTGDLTRRKARMLFAVTYLMTFLSLAVPILLTMVVSQSTYLVEIMQEAPIGLIKGTAKGVTDPQWLLNIGGAVQPSVPSVAPKPASASPAAVDIDHPVAATVPGTESAPGARALSTSELSAKSDDTKVADIAHSGVGSPKVVGGLAVPFYVVMLAMLGAGINMTRKVPPVQIDYESKIMPESGPLLAAALKAPLAWFRPSREAINPEQRKAAAAIRSSLIENYMYLLSAPFLAIAVYYLLQAIGSSPAEPVLVLMAFATGLLADTIIDRIRSFATDTLGGGGGGGGTSLVKGEQTTLAVMTKQTTEALVPAQTEHDIGHSEGAKD
jgi:hypothetical protein